MGATVSLAQPSVAVEPGGEATLEVTIHNNGGVVDEMSIEVVGDAAAWATPDPSKVSLFPGAQEIVRIAFRPPRVSSTRAGSVGFGVMARSREDPEGSSVEEGILDVAGFMAPSAELIPRTSHGSRSARHDVAIDNRGNLAMQAELEGRDPDRLLRFDVDPPALPVDPGVAGFARVDVKAVRPFWRGPAKSRPFQLAVRTGGPDSEPLLLDGNYLQESILPWWFLRALMLAAALLLALILLWVFFLKPELRSTAVDTLEEFGFTPKPGAPFLSEPPDPNRPSPTPLPSNVVSVTAGPEGENQFDGRLDASRNSLEPQTGTLFITDLIFSNPTGASGDLALQRITPTGTTSVLVLRLENFRDLDFHFVTPISVRVGERLVLVPNCAAAPPVACDPSVFYAGYSEDPAE